jgi:two-component system sensor histidine kinase ResE
VKDTGDGIPADEISDLFEKYRQSTSGKISEAKGTGLGLAICKKITEAHGGKISVESRTGEGSIFAVEIPRH